MIQTCENDKNPSFGPDFGPFGSNWALTVIFMDFTSTRSQMFLQAIIVSNFKEK